jgi:hypothetical protein
VFSPTARLDGRSRSCELCRAVVAKQRQTHRGSPPFGPCGGALFVRTNLTRLRGIKELLPNGDLPVMKADFDGPATAPSRLHPRPPDRFSGDHSRHTSERPEAARYERRPAARPSAASYGQRGATPRGRRAPPRDLIPILRRCVATLGDWRPCDLPVHVARISDRAALAIRSNDVRARPRDRRRRHARPDRAHAILFARIGTLGSSNRVAARHHPLRAHLTAGLEQQPVRA